MKGPTVIQSDKKIETYVIGFQAVARKYSLENTDLSIISDSESAALIVSSRASFGKCHMYRCTQHFKKNCEDQLDKIGIPTSKQGLLLYVVFGKDGPVESQDKKNPKNWNESCLFCTSFLWIPIPMSKFNEKFSHAILDEYPFWEQYIFFWKQVWKGAILIRPSGQ